MTDAAQLAPVGSSGVTMYGGVVYDDDQTTAWRGIERDRTIAAMIRDPHIGAILLAVEMFVRRVDWHVEPFDDTPEAEADAAFVQSCLDDMEGTWPGDTLADILTYLPWGYAVLEIVYKRRDGVASVADDGRYGWRGWYLRPQATRDGWVMDGDAPVAFRQRAANWQTVEIPLNRCLYVRYGSSGGSPEGKTPLRHAYDAWYYLRNLKRIEAIGIERDLAGLPMMRVPSRDISNNTATYQAAQQIVTGIRNDAMAGLVLASDRDTASGNYVQDFTLVSSGGARSFDTDAIIRRYSNELVTAFLANVLRVGQDATGAYALSETMGDLFVTSLGAHLDIVQTAVNEQCIRPLLRVNGMDVRRAPVLKHGDIESADIARIGAYLVQLSNTGLLEDTPALRQFVHELAGLPVPSLRELQEAEAEREANAEQMQQQMQPDTPPDATSGPQSDAGDTQDTEDAMDAGDA